MKYFVKFFVITILFFVSTTANAEQKIVVIDMKYILNLSDAGKGAQDFLKKTFTDNQSKFADEEKKLKEEEQKLLGKKTVISKEDYKKESDALRKKVLKYQNDRRTALDDIAKKRASAREQLLNKIDPILDTYIQENGISIVLDKKYTAGGSTDIDITKTIVEKLNKVLPKIKLK